ncbi:hypothetical protein DLW12_22260, partial [Escherichia coli]|nr:hypothetical protein [Escherichia coli]
MRRSCSVNRKKPQRGQQSPLSGCQRFGRKSHPCTQITKKKRKRAARTVLTGMCYSVGSAT